MCVLCLCSTSSNKCFQNFILNFFQYLFFSIHSFWHTNVCMHTNTHACMHERDEWKLDDEDFVRIDFIKSVTKSKRYLLLLQIMGFQVWCDDCVSVYACMHAYTHRHMHENEKSQNWNSSWLISCLFFRSFTLFMWMHFMNEILKDPWTSHSKVFLDKQFW